MRTPKRTPIVLVLTLAVWTVFTWPLPSRMFSAIPSTARNPESLAARRMVPGDHLQLLYHFWLAGDMLRGRTPWFHNLYEFNLGDDAARYRPDPYYMPFSLVYAAGAAMAGAAFGWNLAGLAGLFLALLFTWRLCRRYADEDGPALLAALVAVSLPFGWTNRLGGSPMGFALCLVPAALYGLDRAVREGRFSGGLLAGAAVLFAFCMDMHVFAFTVMAVPFWCLVACVQPSDLPRTFAANARRAFALLPAALLCLLAFALNRVINAHLLESDVAAGRSLREDAAFSPIARGLLAWGDLGGSNQIYLGAVLGTVLAAGAWLLLWRAVRHREGASPRAWTAFLLFCAAAGIVALALGTNGPFHGKLLALCRRFIPKYAMIRQPAKIYCLMPSVIAVLMTLVLPVIINQYRSRRGGPLLAAALTGLILLDHRLQVRPGICLLDRAQPAYAAVADDAALRHGTARLLVLPLWPGNSHWASIYEHYVSLYRLRMVNGYAPTVSRAYFENVFRQLESANQGVLADGQIESLRASGVEYVLLHEDAFPEQVSPFPVGVTLQRLLRHPRLALLRQAGPVWAFRIRPAPAGAAAGAGRWPFFFPAHRWEMERVTNDRASVIEDPSASGGRLLRMEKPVATLLVQERAAVAAAPDMRWTLRARGSAGLKLDHLINARTAVPSELAVNTPAWSWTSLPIPGEGDFFSCALRMTRLSGSSDFDLCVLDAGPRLEPAPGASVEIPAPCFFHAGYTDTNTDAVVFRKDCEPDLAIFYAPFLVLPDGEYRIELTVQSATAAALGRLTCSSGSEVFGPAAVKDGTTSLAFACRDARPVRIEFSYSRAADMAVRGVRLTRER